MSAEYVGRLRSENQEGRRGQVESGDNPVHLFDLVWRGTISQLIIPSSEAVAKVGDMIEYVRKSVAMHGKGRGYNCSIQSLECEGSPEPEYDLPAIQPSSLPLCSLFGREVGLFLFLHIGLLRSRVGIFSRQYCSQQQERNRCRQSSGLGGRLGHSARLRVEPCAPGALCVSSWPI